MTIDAKKIWDFFSGKKSYISLALLFTYGGLSYLGIEVTLIKDIALWLGGIGLTHGVVKGLKK